MVTAVDPLVLRGRSQLGFAVFCIESGMHLLLWAGLVAGLGLGGAVAVVGAVPVVVVLWVVAELLGGSIVRRIAGFRLDSVATGRRATPLIVLRQQVWRLAGPALIRTSPAVMAGRPTSVTAIATSVLGALVATAGVLVGRAGTNDAWAFLAVMSVPLSALGSLVALTAAASLYRQPPDDEPAAAVGAEGGYDPLPVPHTWLDGTQAEVLPGTTSFVTRKRRGTGEVAPPGR